MGPLLDLNENLSMFNGAQTNLLEQKLAITTIEKVFLQ